MMFINPFHFKLLKASSGRMCDTPPPQILTCWHLKLRTQYEFLAVLQKISITAVSLSLGALGAWEWCSSSLEIAQSFLGFWSTSSPLILSRAQQREGLCTISKWIPVLWNLKKKKLWKLAASQLFSDFAEKKHSEKSRFVRKEVQETDMEVVVRSSDSHSDSNIRY